jgi:hypothetical protein
MLIEQRKIMTSNMFYFRMLTEEHEGLVVPSGYRIHALVQMSFEVSLSDVLAFLYEKFYFEE